MIKMGGIGKEGVAPPIHCKFISYIYSTIKARDLNLCTSSLVVYLRSRTKNGRDTVGSWHLPKKQYLENYESHSLETWCELMNDVCEKFFQKWA